MKHFIINPDFRKYVYVCDIHQTDLVFAIPRGEAYEKFKNYHTQYTFDKLKFMPETDVVKVLRLTETHRGYYSLDNENLIEYPARRIYIIYPAAAKCNNR